MKEECGALTPETKSAGTAYPLKPANLMWVGVIAVTTKEYLQMQELLQAP